MVKNLRRDWQLGKVRDGDGSPLADYRWWQLMSRSVFFADLPGEHRYAIDVRYMANPKTKKEHNDGVGKSPAALYRDGVQVARSNLPATFPVPGGVIEVAASSFGLKRLRYVSSSDGYDGGDAVMRPHRRSQEGRRARFDRQHPVASRVVGAATVAVLLVALTIGLLHGIELVTRVPPVAANLGSFTSPVDLPVWGTVALGVAAFLSAMERATRLKHHWLLDSVAS